jgi:hypothetical protein
VASVSGGAPTAYAANQNWRIYRAYTSLSRAESGTTSGMNAAVTALLGAGHAGLDQWAAGRDLVANGEQWNIALYADAADAYSGTALAFDGWTTSETNFLKVFAPSTTSEVGVSQRHAGVWDSTKAHVTLVQWTISLFDPNIVFEGIQVSQDGSLDGHHNIGIGWGLGNIVVKGNILRQTQPCPATDCHGIGIAGLNTGRIYIVNNIVYGAHSCINGDNGDIVNGSIFVIMA